MIGRLRAATLRTSTLDPARWARALDAFADLGFDAVDLCAVWREHELGPGRFDFHAPRRDLAAAVRAAHAVGLRVVLRLGPMATPEAPGLGLPERILRDPSLAARTRRNNPRCNGPRNRLWSAPPSRRPNRRSGPQTSHRWCATRNAYSRTASAASNGRTI